MKEKKTPVISPQGVRDSRIVAGLRLLSATFTGVALVGLARVIGDYAVSGRAEGGRLIVPGVFAVLAAVAAFGEIVYGGLAARKEENRIRRDLLGRLYMAPATSGDDDPAKLVQLLTDNTERVTEFRQIFLGSAIAAMLIPFVTLSYVGVAYDRILGFGIMVLCPLIPLLLAVFMRFFRKTSAHSRRERGKLAGQYLDAIRNLVTIRLLGAGERVEKKLRDQGEHNRGAIMRLLASNQLVIIVVDGLFSLILICATGALTVARFHAGALTLTEAIAVMLLTTLLIEPLVQVAGFFYIGMGGMASQRAIRRYLAAHPDPEGSRTRAAGVDAEARSTDGDTQARSEATARSISLHDVEFNYGRGAVLTGVDLEVPAGTRAAIVGYSGAGKTTLLGLLRGSLRPQAGSLAVDGWDLTTLTPSQVRALTASVAQATWLFTGTIADNLRIAQKDATEAEMWDALRRAQVAEEVERMPRGLDTNVGEQGGLISGGQAQRLSIARALLSGRKILLLDEPTSQVDIESEAKIIEAIRGLGREWTIILVTHRKALLEIADRVYEMRNGTLTEPEVTVR